MSKSIGRNDPCPCGSGKKYKKCCLNKMRSEKHKEFQKSLSVFGASASLVDPTQKLFDSLDSIYASLRSEGFEPVINDIIEFNEDDELLDIAPYDPSYIPALKSYEINLCCKHGYSSESRTYFLRADGKFEWIESGFGIETCPICRA